MVEFSLPRGLRDIPPEESEAAEIRKNGFYRHLRALSIITSWSRLRIQLLETLEAKSGPAIRDEIYFFKDKSERELGLRFDLTVGITRYVTSKREASPRCALEDFGSMWRYDEPHTEVLGGSISGMSNYSWPLKLASRRGYY